MAVDNLTQYFNGRNWKNVNEYEYEEKVLQYNLDGTATLVKPYDYGEYYDEKEPFFEYLDANLPTNLTPNHNIVVREKGYLQILPYNQLRSFVGDYNWEVPIACEMLDNIETRDISFSNELDYAIEAYRNGKVDDECILERYSTMPIPFGEEIGFSDRVFRLCEVNRRKLIGALVCSETPHISRGSASSIINICNITRGYIGLYSCDFAVQKDNRYYIKSSYQKTTYPYKVVNGNIAECENGAELKKYFFGVPSFMMVYRRKGIMFISGCK